MYKNYNGIFYKTRTNNYKICIEHKRSYLAIILRKNEIRGIMLLDFKLHYKLYSMVLTQNRFRVQWNKIENLETNTAIHGHLVFCFFFFFWLHWVFVAAPVLSLGATLCRGAQASQYGIFPCGAQALGTQASVVATCGLSS